MLTYMYTHICVCTCPIVSFHWSCLTCTACYAYDSSHRFNFLSHSFSSSPTPLHTSSALTETDGRQRDHCEIDGTVADTTTTCTLTNVQLLKHPTKSVIHVHTTQFYHESSRASCQKLHTCTHRTILSTHGRQRKHCDMDGTSRASCFVSFSSSPTSLPTSTTVT